MDLSDKAAEEFRGQWEQASAFVDRVVEEFGVENTENLIATCEKFAQTLKTVRKEFDFGEQK